ncbi:MAG: EVE domain-containing protein [Candidatus Abawacabacteria bacterium]|nr:EVE domain-containing protein [Candidatus Abawacabacteria bacterium]
MNYWILKSEPEAYSFDQLKKDKSTAWTGVRNYTARNNLRKMAVGDICFFYHSGDEKQIVGIAKVIKIAYPDPTASGENWTTVDIAYIKPLKPVALSKMKATESLENMAMLKQGRLSVSPITESEYSQILYMSDPAQFLNDNACIAVK